MNPTLMVAYWHHRFTHIVWLIAFGAVVVLPVLGYVGPVRALVHPSQVGNGGGIGLLFVAGLIGLETSSGVLQLVFARPVTRYEYVMSRWLAAVIGGIAASSLQVAIVALADLARGTPFPAELYVSLAGSRALDVVGIVAVVTMFSSFLPGLGDLAIFILASGVATGLLAFGLQLHHPVYAVIGRILGESLSPSLPFPELSPFTVRSAYLCAAYASSVTLSLLVAVLVLNRKQLSYAFR